MLVSNLNLTTALASTSNVYFANNDVLWLFIPSPGVFIVSKDPTQATIIFMDYFSNINLCQSVSPYLFNSYLPTAYKRYYSLILHNLSNQSDVKDFNIFNFINSNCQILDWEFSKSDINNSNR
jgi:hypothetical protein